MASSKERARWERWYEQVTARMNRQKMSIDRLVLINTECMAALMEIAAMEEPVGMEDDNRAPAMRKRAQEALDRVGEAAAATTGKAVESAEVEEPIVDPRNNGGK
jgi:hypothetical protein